MSTSQEPQAALVSVQDQVTINRILDTNLGETTETESIELLMVTQQILSRVAQYSQPVREIQQVCSHPAEIADLRNQITILRAQTQPPPARVRPCRLRDTIDDPPERTGGSPTNPPDSGDRRRSEEGVGRHDQRRPRSQRGGPEFEDAVSECAILSRTGSPSSPPAT